MKRGVVFAVLALAAAVPSSGYYHFVHYLSTGNAPEKFDLTALTGNTVTFFVSENGPTTYSPTDSFNSVVSQIQQAAAIWNGVATSSLRVAFGGFENSATIQNTPGGDVVFADLPPGVEGMAGPVSLSSPVQAADKTWFFPVVRSVMYLSNDLTVAPGPSFDQSFLMTTLHEMGHALGLQHPFTSATMSQATTRATTLTHPLDNDDIAGLSVLYPASNFSQFGSIAGQITASGKGVHLASVVAIQPGSGAVSGVTNQDGTFRIDGIPPGQYAVYVHTMPPDADVLGPWDASGNVVAASGAVNTLFYGNTTSFAQAKVVTVTAGSTIGGVNISTSTRASVPFYDGQIFGYFNNDTIETYPAPVAISGNESSVVASVVGLGSNGQVPGLNVQFPGGAVSLAQNGGIVPFAAYGNTYIELNFNFNQNAQPGTQHVIFTTPDYTYVLPSAMYFTQTGPPTVTGVTSNGDGTLTVTGTNWTASTLIYFDALPATISSLDSVNGIAILTPPPGASGQQSTVAAYNTDGQNSQILQSGSPVTYSYGKESTPLITSISPTSLPAGAEATIDITSLSFSFVQGLTTVGFGTSDILVQRVFVLSPNHLQVDVAIAPGAALSQPDVSLMSGFEMVLAPAGFRITPSVAGVPTPYPVLFNAVPPLGGAYPGAIVSLYGSNFSNASTVTIGGQPAHILYSSPGQINLQIPNGLTPGPQVLIVNNGQTRSYPVDVNIDPPPAEINALQTTAGAYIDSSQPAFPGATLIVSLLNFAPAGENIAASRVQVSLGGVTYTPSHVTTFGSIGVVTFTLGQSQPVGQAEELVVYLDGRSSVPAFVPVVRAGG